MELIDTTTDKQIALTAIPVIIIDTREKPRAAYGFPGYSTKRQKLRAGDYSVAGLEGCLSVERKTLDDFVQTVIRGWERFTKELAILADYKYRVIIIEGTLEDIVKHNYTSKAHPNAIMGRCRVIKEQYGINLFWAGDRETARAETEKFLISRYNRECKQYD